jgi:replication factor C subunit 3/5
MLWVDKHRPKSMKELDYHVELSESLKSMVERGDFPHILFYGPSGAGKKTRVLALLRDIYGPAIDKVKVEHKQFKVGSTTVEVPILSSAHHIELNPGDAGNRDRDVVQELIKEIAASAPLPTSSSGDTTDWKPFKVVVLNEVDNLSKDAQHALRRTMEKCARRPAPREPRRARGCGAANARRSLARLALAPCPPLRARRYISTCRIMMTCNNASRVIAPVRSRCLCVRIAAPSPAQIAAVLHATARKEALTLPDPLAEKLALQAHGNLRKALLTLEAARVRATRVRALRVATPRARRPSLISRLPLRPPRDVSAGGAIPLRSKPGDQAGGLGEVHRQHRARVRARAVAA